MHRCCSLQYECSAGGKCSVPVTVGSNFTQTIPAPTGTEITIQVYDPDIYATKYAFIAPAAQEFLDWTSV